VTEWNKGPRQNAYTRVGKDDNPPNIEIDYIDYRVDYRRSHLAVLGLGLCPQRIPRVR